MYMLHIRLAHRVVQKKGFNWFQRERDNPLYTVTSESIKRSSMYFETCNQPRGNPGAEGFWKIVLFKSADKNVPNSAWDKLRLVRR